MLSSRLSAPQVTASHSDVAPEPHGSSGLLQVSLQGTPLRAVGTVQGSTPLLLELGGATFKQPAPLAGHVLVYRAKASEPSTLPTLAGELLVSPRGREQPEGVPKTSPESIGGRRQGGDARRGGKRVAWARGWGLGAKGWRKG